jgi:hypothetical protein
LDKWTNVVHAAGDVDSWAGQLLDCAARIAAHYPQVGVWDFSVDERQYLRSEEQNALLVRRPIPGSREDHRMGWHAVRGAKEIDVYARSNRGDASGLDVARKESAVLLGNRDDVIGLARVSDFGIAKGPPHFPIHKFLYGVAGCVEMLFSELRLHVVREKNFGAGKFPIDQARRINEIADQHVEVPARSIRRAQAEAYIFAIEIPEPASGFSPITCMLCGSDENRFCA